MPITRGRLQSPDTAPTTGEQTHRLAEIGEVVVDQILSGRLDGPVDYRQDTDEWVVVLDGGATLDVDGQRMHLRPGDWVLLPAGTPHCLVETEAATSWLTVTGVSSADV
ncbi:MAG TPA: cupin domain-containing protein [Acidimicrobiales bacterium]|nr:cupin domain-containing protein [Acidimicrobiales bacterium]